MKAAILSGAGLVFSYFLVIGYAPIDSLAGVSSLAAFVAFIGVLLALSYTILWAMPTMVLHEWSTDAHGQRLISGLMAPGTNKPSPWRLMLFSAGTMLAPGLVYWPFYIEEFIGHWSILSWAIGVLLFAWNVFMFCRPASGMEPQGAKQKHAKSKKRENSDANLISIPTSKLTSIKDHPATITISKLTLLILISLMSLPAILPATNLIEHSSYVSENSNLTVVALLYFSLVVVAVSHMAIWRFSLATETSEASRYAATVGGALLSIGLLTLLLGSPIGVMKMIMGVSSMRLERADVWVDGNFCSALADRDGQTSTSITRCLLRDVRVTSRLGDRWWLDCTQANDAANVRRAGFSLPSAQVITWVKKAPGADAKDTTPLASGNFKRYSAVSACALLAAP